MEIGGGRKSGIKRVARIESSLVIRNRNVQSNVYEPPVRCQWDPARINKQIIERIRGIRIDDDSIGCLSNEHGHSKFSATANNRTIELIHGHFAPIKRIFAAKCSSEK